MGATGAVASSPAHRDKFLHGLVSFLMVLVLYPFISLEGAIFVAVLVGISKEVYDHLGNGTASVLDFVADIIGVIIAYGMITGVS